MSDGLKLLGAVISNGSLDTFRKLESSLFIGAEKPVYEFIKRHFRNYSQLPNIVTVEDEVGLRFPVINEQAKFYEKKVRDRKLYGGLFPRFQSLRDALKSNDMDAARELIGVMRMLAQANSVDEEIRNVYQAGRTMMREYEESQIKVLSSDDSGISGVPSGWFNFDSQTGGYQPGDLISFVARMGIGKTQLLLKQALYAWDSGYSVLIVTMEMVISALMRRMAGMHTGINPKYIIKGMLSTEAERRLRSVVANFQNVDRLYMYAGGFTKRIDDVEILMQEYNPDIVFIDGVYLLSPESARQMHRLERIAEVMDSVKRITITQNRPIVTTSQFSRQAGKGGREGSLENIGFTDAIAMHSSLVVSVKEGKMPNPTTRRLLSFLKTRESEAGKDVQVNYSFSPMNFEAVPEATVRAEATDINYMGGGRLGIRTDEETTQDDTE